MNLRSQHAASINTLQARIREVRGSAFLLSRLSSKDTHQQRANDTANANDEQHQKQHSTQQPKQQHQRQQQRITTCESHPRPCCIQYVDSEDAAVSARREDSEGRTM